MAKLKMNQKKFIAIWAPVLCVTVGVLIAATSVMNYYSAALDTYLGRGEKKVVNSGNSSEWDLNYYNSLYGSTAGENGSQLSAAKVAKQISDEGTVLLKNNGVLPLAKDSEVAPFGFRYYNPFYGGSGSGSVVTTDAYVVSPQKALESNFKVDGTFAGVTDDTPVRKYYYDTTKGNDVLYFFEFTNSFNGSDQSIYEFDKSVYQTDGVGRNSTAVIFLGRAGGENNDLWSVPYNMVGDVNAGDAGTAAAKISAVKNAEPTSEVKYALDLMPEEKEMIELAKDTCNNVVVVVNSSNAMELGALADDDEIDAILWIGGPGAKGFQSLSDILVGDVNPSGRTVDVYVRDLSLDPTYKNLGDIDGYTYTNTEGLAPMQAKQYSDSRKESNTMNYIEYEEGVYLGYKYYETAHDTSLAGFTYGELNGDGSTKTQGQVVYPFGYGLSYTEFSQKIVSFSGNENEVSVTVEVKNEGDVAGKEVVEVYWTAPYTDLDRQLLVEKPTALLAGFGKTNTLKPGDSELVTVTFRTDDMASYSYLHKNSDGTTGCYLLDEGEYTISLRKNSHEVIDKRTFSIDETIFFDAGNPRQSEKDGQAALDENGNPTSVPAKALSDSAATFVAATNHFEDSNLYMTSSGVQALTRSTANGMAVSSLIAGEKYKEAPDWVVSLLKPYAVDSDPELGNVSGSKVYKTSDPVSKADNGLSLTSFRGVDYFDPSWNDLLDQINYENAQLITLMFKDQYAISPLDEIGLGASKALDGPQGLTISSSFGADNLSTCAYSTEPVVAATFNAALAYEYGVAIGQEALTIGCTGWYAPGLNTHRTAFSGRNFEYYSEDGVLAGKMAARVISGAAEQGLACYMKHFALNDNDSNRANICVWANEQAIREIYLKSFEIAVKEARASIEYIADENGTHETKIVRGATALMTSYNYIGATFSSGHYGLLTETLRGEWGFQGAVISDMTGGSAMRRDQTLRAGNDMILYFAQINATDTTSASAKWAMRDAVHHIAYMVVNSNWMQGAAPGAVIYYTTSPWMIGLIVANVVGYLFVAGMIVWMVVRGFDSKKHPENYRQKK